jgi:predicted anti-sigma-YlaC factor YlaD
VDCRQAAELTPWLHNGSLEGAERSDLERHLEGCDACRAELREAEAARLLFGGHPPVEMLVEYAADGAGAARSLVEAHLAGCDSCTEELAMVLDSRRAMAGAMATAAVDMPATPDNVVPLRQPRAAQPIWRAAAVAAAVIGLIGVGGGLWSWSVLNLERNGFAERQRAAESRIAELEAELHDLEGARLNVAIHDLWPDGSVVRSAASGPMRLPAEDGPAATLVLNSQLEPGRQVARLEIRDAEGRPLYSLDGVRAGAGGSITLSLALSRLPRGELQIVLFGPEGAPLESYSFELG